MQTGERRIDAICLSSKMKRHVARAFPRGTTSLFRFQKLAKFLSYPLFPRSIPLHSEIEEDQKHFFADFWIWPMIGNTLEKKRKISPPFDSSVRISSNGRTGRLEGRRERERVAEEGVERPIEARRVCRSKQRK